MTERPSAPRACRVPWAELLKKVFDVDVLACPECGGRLRLIAFMADGKVAGRILDHLGLDAAGPPLVRAHAQPEQPDLEPDYVAADATYEAWKRAPVGDGRARPAQSRAVLGAPGERPCRAHSTVAGFHSTSRRDDSG